MFRFSLFSRTLIVGLYYGINTKPCCFLRIFGVMKNRCPSNRWRLMRFKINRPASPTYILLLYFSKVVDRESELWEHTLPILDARQNSCRADSMLRHFRPFNSLGSIKFIRPRKTSAGRWQAVGLSKIENFSVISTFFRPSDSFN